MGKRKETEPTTAGIAVERLRSFIDRVERLKEEIKALQGDVRDIFTEAKSAGFDVKVLRLILARRTKEPAEIEELETLLDVYELALNGNGNGSMIGHNSIGRIDNDI